jgi:putative ABC transport system substrate-binding protein
MKRREFISLLSAAVAPWPHAARAQKRPTVGYLAIQRRAASAEVEAAFLRGLAETGFSDGRNVTMVFRYAEGQPDQLAALAADLVARNVSVIASMGGSASPLAAKAATSRLPIVFTTGDADPVHAGLVASLARPGGNVTGVSFLGGFLGTKRLEILRELVPAAATIGVLVNPHNRTNRSDTEELQAAVIAGRQRLAVIAAGPTDDLAAAFAGLRAQGIDALIVTADPTFTIRRTELAVLSARHGVPTIYQWSLFVAAGGLISYGAELADGYRHAGVYTGRILKGEKPADLPVMQPTKFNLAINLKTARALGLAVPATMLARADEVIE